VTVAGAIAIVPACGQSTRMGRPKLLLPLGSRSVIERVVGTLRDGGARHVLVVTGPHVPELVPLARSAGAEVLVLEEPTPDMRTTVERGLAWIEDRHHPAPDDRWLLAPADHPAFSANTVRELLAAGSQESIAIPTHDGRRGHPAVLRWRHAAGIRATPPGDGINSYLRSLAAEIVEITAGDPGVLANLDTPEDYARLRSAHD
jgi:molybdenum cofactor cytidylyltransferase